ncbi:MAG: hypothetical protein HRU15_05120 [Planctomycetes bacterium]|nr:hypothetical protein [Planctomycetota bacterium]
MATHWSGDYRTADIDVLRLAEIDLACLDAYHWQGGLFGKRSFKYLYDVLVNSTNHVKDGLQSVGKPVVVTEFGGSPLAAPVAQLTAEHNSGPWIGLVSGHAMAPFLWWYEWVDQQDQWHPYRSLQNFLGGEDLRHVQARSLSLACYFSGNKSLDLWARAWAYPGNVFVYCLDKQWSLNGKDAALHHGGELRIGGQVAAGSFTVQWWDPSRGCVIQQQQIMHKGGELFLSMPEFRRHLALKCKRIVGN